MTGQKMDLLQTIQTAVGCSYLSDLHKGVYDQKIRFAVEALSPHSYSLKDWQEAIVYITKGKCPCEDEDSAQKFLSKEWKR